MPPTWGGKLPTGSKSGLWGSWGWRGPPPGIGPADSLGLEGRGSELAAAAAAACPPTPLHGHAWTRRWARRATPWAGSRWLAVSPRPDRPGEEERSRAKRWGPARAPPRARARRTRPRSLSGRRRAPRPRPRASLPADRSRGGSAPTERGPRGGRWLLSGAAGGVAAPAEAAALGSRAAPARVGVWRRGPLRWHLLRSYCASPGWRTLPRGLLAVAFPLQRRFWPRVGLSVAWFASLRLLRCALLRVPSLPVVCAVNIAVRGAFDERKSPF